MKSDLHHLAVVLVRTRNPLNIGAVARAMQNFGVHDLRLVTPFEASFRESRSAVGAGGVLAEAREFASIADAVADCHLVIGTTAARRRQLEQRLVDLGEAGASVHAALKQDRVAMLFGSEKHGLTREDFDHCHWLVRITTEGTQPSMNLGQAVAVCLWELARENTASAVEDEIRANSEDVDRLGALLIELLHESGYTDPETAASTTAEVRRMLRRIHVTDVDTHMLMGMIRKVLWKLASRGKDAG